MTQPEEAKGVLLEARNLEKSFGGVRAVQGTSIDLAAGSVAGLVGPNGAGKTTIFNLLTGFIAPDAGSVRFKDQELVGLVPQSIAVLGVGRTFQDLRLFERMSVLENVLIYSTERFDRLTDVLIPRRSVRRKHQRALSRARESLEHVGLGKKASVRAADLSFAEQKLLALARVIALDPTVVLLDEPTSGLDRGSIEFVMELVRRLAEQDRAVAVVEHNLEVIRGVADTVLFMNEGRVVVQDAPARVFADERLATLYMGVKVR